MNQSKAKNPLPNVYSWVNKHIFQNRKPLAPFDKTHVRRNLDHRQNNTLFDYGPNNKFANNKIYTGTKIEPYSNVENTTYSHCRAEFIG